MKKTLIIRLLALLLLAVMPLNVSAKKKKEMLRYEIEAAGVGVEGTYLVKAYVLDKKGKVSDEMIKEAAIRGVIFRGFAAANGAPSQKAMASPAVELEKAVFFDDFFTSGAHLGYANIVAGSNERTKTASGDYRVGATVQVQKTQLRRFLEEAGVIRGLNTGF